MNELTHYVTDRIVIPRWVLVIKYCAFILIGVTVVITTSPSLNLTTASGYTPVWGGMLIGSAIICVVGSLRGLLEPIERWGVLMLSALLLGYAFAPLSLVFHGDTDKAVYSSIALTLCILPAVRAIQLIRQSGVQHARR
jgi:hypothetical protein